MKIAVALLLGVLATWTFSALVRQIARRSYRTEAKLKHDFRPELLYREVFHFLVCLILLILLLEDQVAPVIISILTAVLFLGFEYALAITRKWRQ